MKKSIFFFTIILFTLTVQAQKSKIVGSWLMTKVETAEGVQEPYFITNFKDDGSMEVMGIPVGTWKYDEGSKSIVMNSKMDKDFNGPAKIEKLTKTNLVVTRDGVKMYYDRVDRKEIETNNLKLPVEGVWHGKNENGGEVFLKFTAPDSLLVLSTGDGSIDRAHSRWLYYPKDKSMIIMGFSRLLRGKCNVDISGDKLSMDFGNNKQLSFTKEPEIKVERLTYKEDEFPEESPDESKLPWIEGGTDRLITVLEPVKELKFRRGVWLPDVGVFLYTTLVSKIKVNPDDMSVVYTNLSIDNGDTMQYSQNVKGELQNSYNNFFPFEDIYLYRVTGKEKIKVPAGEFDCTVVEGIDGDAKVKLWMVDQMPGVYAKIIRDEPDPFGDINYIVKELTSVEKRK